MNAPVVLQSRVDALVLAYQVRVPSAVDDEIKERQSFSDLARVAELSLGDFRFAMKRNRSIDRFCFENHDCRCLYDCAAPNGWNLEVVPRATFLATHSLLESLALSKSVAQAMGAVWASRLRRTDLAADYMHFALCRLDADHFFTTRAKTDGFLVEPKDVDGLGVADFSEHLDAKRQVTGVSIARGNPFSARVYNKRAELALPGREEKRAIEEARWRSGGWTGKEEVARVELQVRGEALDDLDLRNPDDLDGRLDSVWQYGVQWTRLVRPIRRRLRECPLDPRWEPVVKTVFNHASEPATRSRVRGGATAQQALGTAISRLGAIGHLPWLAQGNEAAFIAKMTLDEAESWLKRGLQVVFERQAEDCFRQLMLTKGAVAPLWFLIKVNAMRAGYSSVDDLHEELLGPADSDGVLDRGPSLGSAHPGALSQ